MIVYWFMFISCTVLAYFSQRKCVEKTGELGETKLVPNRAFVIMSAIPLVFFTGMRGYVGDTTVYIKYFNEMDSDLITTMLENPNEYKDVGFYLLEYIVKSIVDDPTVWFFVVAVFCVFCVWKTMYKYSDSFTLSVYLYFGMICFYWLFNGMRQCIAITAAFLMFPLVIKSGDSKNDLKRFALFVVFALLISTIHFSALVVIPICFLCRGKLFGRWHIITIAAITVLSTMVDPVVKFLNDTFSDTIYFGITEDLEHFSVEGNIIRLVVACVPVFLCVYRLKAVKKLNDPVFNFCLNMSLFNVCIMVPATFISGNQFARLAEYCNVFNLLLYPMILNRLYSGRIKRLLTVGLVFAYLAWFHYDMFVVHHISYHSLVFGMIG